MPIKSGGGQCVDSMNVDGFPLGFGGWEIRTYGEGWRDGSAPAALPELLSSIPSNHMVAHNHL